MTAAAVTRRRDRDATRARVLKAAIAEFSGHGFDGARGERIAARARCSERMVYYYFGSKEALFRAALETVYAQLRDAERSLQLDELPALEALESFCRFVWRYYAQHPEFLSLLNAENLHQARHLKKSARLPELVSPVVGMLAALLERGCHQRVFRAGLDPIELYVAIASLGYFVLSNRHTLSTVLGRDLGEPAYLEQHWEQSVELVRRYVVV
ncbi:MAG: TetR/AcrR family transcriptional regulator [Quisquiliibacterium sp.]